MSLRSQYARMLAQEDGAKTAHTNKVVSAAKAPIPAAKPAKKADPLTIVDAVTVAPNDIKIVTKSQITLRLDDDIIETFRATGKGWQTRINTVLRRALNLTDP